MDAALINRFRESLDALGITESGIGLAVSGGPDSLALLLLAHAAFPGQIEAATVDHGLRPESAAEARSVAELCTRLNVPHQTLAVTVPDGKAGVQGEARAARYEVLRTWCEARGLRSLLTGHHQDDQAETLLMRLQRGAGIAGLSGIRPARWLGPELTLARPLLGWRKAELVALVAEAGLAPVDDPSNRDERFDRSRARALLAAHPELEAARLARSAAALREAHEALDWQAVQLWPQRCAQAHGEWRLDVADLPRELRRRLLVRAIAAARAAHALTPSWSADVETLLRTLEQGGTGTQAGIQASGGPVWHLRPAPPRRSP